MFSGKLSRLAGLVVVLVALVGGGSAYEIGAQHGTGGTTINAADAGAKTGTLSSQPGEFRTFELDWT
jgi:hypothetical protein